MLRKMRKHGKWLMAGFGVLLMLAWLQGPTTGAIAKMTDRVMATIDGQTVRGAEFQTATRELAGLSAFYPALTRVIFGVDERDTAHWLLLVKEAEEAGLVGEKEDGRAFVDEVASLALQQDFQLQIEMMRMENPPKTRDEAVALAGRVLMMRMQQGYAQGMRGGSEDEVLRALARARGVTRLISAHSVAARVSDRQTVREARKSDDAAVVDYAFLPAEPLLGTIAEPDATALAAHFEQFKTTKPGEGDYGIGYFLPPRIKLEWLTLDRKAIEAAVNLDPVDVRKRYNEVHKGAPVVQADLEKIEATIRGERADRVMQEAQVVMQAEMGRATRGLERDGKYRKLPTDWEAKRPQFGAVAAAIQEQVSKAVGFQVPLPAVTVKTGAWVERSEVFSLPGIGPSSLRTGGIEVPFTDVAFWVRELKPKESPLAVQVGMPVYENYLTDGFGNRYYFTVLATRDESAPDSVEDIRERAVRDFKMLRAFEALKARADEFKAAAVTGGLDGAALVYAATPPGAGAKPIEKPKVEVAARVRRVNTGLGQFANDEALRKAVLEAAEKFDPKSPPDLYPLEQAMLVIPSSKNLGLVVVKIRAFVPVTREDYVRLDGMAERLARQEEIKKEGSPGAAPPEAPFGLDALLRRHEYIVGEQRVRTKDDLHKSENAAG